MHNQAPSWYNLGNHLDPAHLAPALCRIQVPANGGPKKYKHVVGPASFSAHLSSFGAHFILFPF